MAPARQFIALLAAAVLLAAAFVALDRAHHGQPAADVAPAASADAQRSPKPPERTGQFVTGASGAGGPGGSDDAAMDVGDILEPMAAQLADLLEHLRQQCTAARRAGDRPAPSAVAPCITAGETTASTVEFVRGTLASEAGKDVSEGVRSRWTRDLDAAAAEVRTSLIPVDRSLGRALASGAPSPAAFRELAHLRDRIARVLVEMDRP